MIEKIVELLSRYTQLCTDQVNAQRIALTAEILHDRSPTELEFALKCHFRESNWFPTPSQLLKHLERSDEEASQEAWVKVLEAVRRQGYYGGPPKLEVHERRALEAIGGWQSLCLSDMDHITIMAAQFKKACALFRSVDRRENGLLSLNAGSNHLLDQPEPDLEN
jgi:hypothetical protein